jgi:hypothetical protein
MITKDVRQMNAGIDGTREELDRLNGNIEEVKTEVLNFRNRISRHFRNNKNVYIAAASGVLAGWVGATLTVSKPKITINQEVSITVKPGTVRQVK